MKKTENKHMDLTMSITVLYHYTSLCLSIQHSLAFNLSQYIQLNLKSFKFSHEWISNQQTFWQIPNRKASLYLRKYCK